MAPDKFCSVIIALCGYCLKATYVRIFHYLLMDEPFAFEETGHLPAKHHRDQFAIHKVSGIKQI